MLAIGLARPANQIGDVTILAPPAIGVARDTPVHEIGGWLIGPRAPTAIYPDLVGKIRDRFAVLPRNGYRQRLMGDLT
jgi:hypothetical protein